MATQPKTTISTATNVALDAAYNKTAGPMLKQIAALSTGSTSKMQTSLKKLDQEAQRLQDEKRRMEIDNAQLEQTLAAYEDTIDAAATLIQANDSAIQASGVLLAPAAVTAKVFLSLSGQVITAGGSPVAPAAVTFYTAQLAAAGVKWKVPTALDFAKDFVDSPAWRQRLEQWGPGYADLSRKAILHSIQNGAGPRAVASQMRHYAENIPVAAAENLTRTLQLTSYREASLAMEKLNGGFIESKIRIATLDADTCLSCIALHGTRLEPGQRVDDHFRGRCSEFYVVPGGGLPEFMQSDSRPGERNFVPFQTGEAWFASLPPERQAQQASFLNSPAKLEAYNSGVTLSDFVGEHTDSVFGRQVVEQSLVAAVGEEAAKGFYK